MNMYLHGDIPIESKHCMLFILIFSCLLFYHLLRGVKPLSQVVLAGGGSAVRKETACGGEVGSGREAWGYLT